MEAQKLAPQTPEVFEARAGVFRAEGQPGLATNLERQAAQLRASQPRLR